MKASDYVAAHDSSTDARHVVIYGAPKTGKTELAGSMAAESFRLWWFNLDGGFKTLARPDSIARQHLGNIELFNIPDSQLFPVAAPTMLTVFKGHPCTICHHHGHANCPDPDCKKEGAFDPISLKDFDLKKDILVIDHFSQLMDSVVNHTHRKKLAIDDFDIKSDWDDWARQGAISDRFGSTIQQAKYNVIVITHEVMATMQDGTKKLAPVGGTRNQSSDFGKYFDDIVYTELRGGQLLASCSAGDKTGVVIGSRTGKKLTAKKNGQQTLVELFK